MDPRFMNPLMQHSPLAIKKPMPKLDPEFEIGMDGYIDTVIEEEKAIFQPGLESFQVHANRIRQQIRDEMIAFQRDFQNGFDIANSWLDAHKIARPVVSPESASILRNKEQYAQKVNEGKYLFEIMGFSEEDLKTFYTVAFQLAQDNELAKSRDVSFFLVTIAPYVADFWFCLAVATTQLHEYDRGLEASLQVIAIDPSRLDGYMNALHIYAQKNDSDKAHALCKQGIEFAKNQDPLAKELLQALQDAESFIKL